MKKHYHFVGIGGIGMGAIASLLLDQGYKITGSDIRNNTMTQSLRKKGARVFIEHDRRHIKGADYIILSSAIREDNPELLEAKRQGIPIIKRAKLLSELMQDHIGITVAGAHGKTTTTSMISRLLKDAGFEPTTAIGGLVNGTTSNATLGKGKYFVAEVDESDGSFLYFSPRYSVITNIDREHLDYYQTMGKILRAYHEFMCKTEKGGIIFACGDDSHLKNLLKKTQCSYRMYGISSGNDIIADNIVLKPFGSLFDCYDDGRYLGKVELKIPGQHNVVNALACIGLGLSLSIDFPSICESLKQYRGVQRRFQLLGDIRGIRIVDDYGLTKYGFNMFFHFFGKN